jgi:hypothetical protein
MLGKQIELIGLSERLAKKYPHRLIAAARTLTDGSKRPKNNVVEADTARSGWGVVEQIESGRRNS